jgi:Ribosomal protein TL5, C-terminal domain
VAELQIDQSIKVGDLKLPEGVKVKNDPESIVVQVSKKIEEEVAPVVAAPAAEGTEPEVIGRAKEGEEGEEDEKKEKEKK